jgi:hypothetical protein
MRVGLCVTDRTFTEHFLWPMRGSSEFAGHTVRLSPLGVPLGVDRKYRWMNFSLRVPG